MRCVRVRVVRVCGGAATVTGGEGLEPGPFTAIGHANFTDQVYR